jgi:hypothetical protein
LVQWRGVGARHNQRLAVLVFSSKVKIEPPLIMSKPRPLKQFEKAQGLVPSPQNAPLPVTTSKPSAAKTNPTPKKPR